MSWLVVPNIQMSARTYSNCRKDRAEHKHPDCELLVLWDDGVAYSDPGSWDSRRGAVTLGIDMAVWQRPPWPGVNWHDEHSPWRRAVGHVVAQESCQLSDHAGRQARQVEHGWHPRREVVADRGCEMYPACECLRKCCWRGRLSAWREEHHAR